jgi:outer membrane murein-binding lipoprotein Lpp
MKRAGKFHGAAILAGAILIAGCAKKEQHLFSSLKDPATVTQLKSFVAEKQAQADAATNEAAPGFAPFFAAAKTGDWPAVSNAFANLRNHAGQYEHSGKTDERLHGPRWEAVKEVWGAFDAFCVGDDKYAAAFGRDIIASIPPGSIYFGGTDPGRFIVTALEKSQVDGDPFFTLTQNALADGSYLDYLRSIYGGKIYIPTPEDSQKSFQDYTEDATRRQQKNQLKPGEDVHTDNGRVQISGQVAVMEINGLLVKTIFDKNPDREFYIEESFPLDWMYSNLEPHGLIMKINRQPLADLSGVIVQTDTDYWAKQVSPMIGGWLSQDTTVAEVAAFAEKIYVKRNFSGFADDPQFIQSDYAQKMFSKLRSSQAGLYAWRAQHAKNAAEKNRMNDAADFAFRQAWALCPYSPEAVYRYVNLLLNANRSADALLIAETAAKMPPTRESDSRQFQELAAQLKRYQHKN